MILGEKSKLFSLVFGCAPGARVVGLQTTWLKATVLLLGLLINIVDPSEKQANHILSYRGTLICPTSCLTNCSCSINRSGLQILATSFNQIYEELQKTETDTSLNVRCAYFAVFLGHLAKHSSPIVRKELSSYLSGDSFQSITDVLGEFLTFHVTIHGSTGDSDYTKSSLEHLIQIFS